MKTIICICLLLSFVACHEKPVAAIQQTDTYYTCSMHPQVRQNAPGKCPICQMDLILVKKGTAEKEPTVTLSEQQIQLGNIHLDTLNEGSIGAQTVLSATLNVDETKSLSVNARIAGRIEKLYVKSVAAYIKKGDRLYELYSEELNNAKQEYILALEKQKVLDNTVIDLKQLVISARNKLLLWGMNESQIEELSRTQKASPTTTFYSPGEGTITTLESHEGDYVTEGTPLLRLANLSTLWAEAQVYTSQLTAIDRNGTATVQLPDQGGRTFTGRIEFVNPEINPAARINLIRVVIANSGNQLQPGMPAYVVVKNRQTSALSLPTDAVIREEKQSIVWLQVEHNIFKRVKVETGIEDADRIEIKSGLKAGDIVVTSGAYLINSEYIFKQGADTTMAGHSISNL